MLVRLSSSSFFKLNARRQCNGSIEPKLGALGSAMQCGVRTKRLFTIREPLSDQENTHRASLPLRWNIHMRFKLNCILTPKHKLIPKPSSSASQCLTDIWKWWVKHAIFIQKREKKKTHWIDRLSQIWNIPNSRPLRTAQEIRFHFSLTWPSRHL